MGKIGIPTALVLGFFLAAPAAWATCGASNCFLETGTQEGVSSKGQWTFDLSYRFIPMDHGQRGSESEPFVLIPKIDFENGIIVPPGARDSHIEKRTNNELVQLDIAYGVTDRMKLRLAIPLINNRTHEHDHFPGGSFSREDSTDGFGDVRAIGEYSLLQGERHQFSVGLGMKFPSGEYKLRDHDGGINEPTIQPGSGSWDPLFSTRFSYELIPNRLQSFLSGSYQWSTENQEDYEFGDQIIAGAGLNLRVAERLIPSLQVNFRFADRDEFKGMKVPSTGGTWIYLTPGLKVHASPNTALYTHVQIPVYRYVNDVNLVPRYGLMLGFSYTFGGNHAFPLGLPGLGN
jgi:hypothetical protein